MALFYSLVATAQLNHANDYYYIKYLCEHIPGGLLGPVGQLSDEELEALMPWSKEYRAYEKREIEARFDAVTLGNDMKKPDKEDIQKMRSQMEEEDSAVSESSPENNAPMAAPAEDTNTDPSAFSSTTASVSMDNPTAAQTNPDQAYENSLIEIQTSDTGNDGAGRETEAQHRPATPKECCGEKRLRRTG